MGRTILCCTLLYCAACPGETAVRRAPASAPATRPTSAAGTPAVCRPAGVALDVDETWTAGGRAGFCLDLAMLHGRERPADRNGLPLPLCATFDPRRRVFARSRGAPQEKGYGGYPSAVFKGSLLTVCQRPGSCRKIATKHGAADGYNTAAAVNRSYTRAVAISQDGGTDPDDPLLLWAEIYEPRSGRRLKLFPVKSDGYGNAKLRWLTERTFALRTAADGPDASYRLFDGVAGKLLATVGERPGDKKSMPLNLYSEALARIAGSRWAFLDIDGTRLAIYDVDRGALLGEAKLARYYGRPGGTDVEQQGSDFAVVGGQLVVILASPSDDVRSASHKQRGYPGTAVVLDGRTARVISVTRLPGCPKAAHPRR